jgi:hypothetical protein
MEDLFVSNTVDGFIPIASWFKFPNQSFNHSVGYWHNLPIVFPSYGMCGGMVFAVADYFESSECLPNEEYPGKILGEDLKLRQADSINLNTAWNYLLLTLENQERDYSYTMEAWKMVKEDVDNNHPSPIGVIRIKSINPFKVFNQHQLLAYGYQINKELITINVYDQNFPYSDNLKLSFNTSSNNETFKINSSAGLGKVHSFFKAPYEPKQPSSFIG